MMIDKTNSAICPAIKELIALKYYASTINFFGHSKVKSNYIGNKLSMARGRGVDFDEVRHYQAGDDVRLIHWSLTARLGKPYTKVYKEERDRAVYIIVDQSQSMFFGTKVSFKNVLAAKIASILGWAALNNHEQVGGIVFADNKFEYIKAKHSRQQLLSFFNFLHDNELIKREANGISSALEFLSTKVHTGSVVIVISDFLNFDAKAAHYLQLINRKAELINIMTYDPLEEKLPDHGFYSFTDGNRNKISIDANQKNKQKYHNTFAIRLNNIQNLSTANQMQFVKIATNDDIINTINRGVLKHGY